MSIDVTIRQKSLMKKELPLKVILGNNLSYGTFDGLRLVPGVINGNEFIAYNSDRIGRGFSVTYDPAKKKEITLRALTPTSTEELHEFYQCVGRIVNHWKCELEVDGEKITPDAFQRGLPQMCRFNEGALRNFSDDILNGEKGNLTLFCAFWPLVIGKDEAELFEKDGVGAFRDWLHKKQSMDAYYAKPGFFDENGTVIGRYVLTENTLSIFPLKGHVPFGSIDKRTNKPLVCDGYKMAFSKPSPMPGGSQRPTSSRNSVDGELMFGHKEKKKNAELLAPIWLDDMRKARDVVNNTTDPDSFFTDYASLKDLAGKLTELSKYVKFKGTKPAEVLRMTQEQEEAATRDFILRYFQKTLLNAEKVKTVRGKRSQFEKFQTALEPYYYQMSAANVALVQQLHDEALAKIGG